MSLKKLLNLSENQKKRKGRLPELFVQASMFEVNIETLFIQHAVESLSTGAKSEDFPLP